ncbi:MULTISPECIES: DUF1264 domain-containing protein [Luteimonas]|uniref:DUF1264 domain-containing protein n=1 Tax=Luteimonas TaxID=83614 RepID=UPI000C7B9368|nr:MULTISPECIES: DUF1264 domain-containing protein [Luteimonas]
MHARWRDGGASANLTGIEYIVSARVFAGLPDGERDYWHPHNGEILSRQLVAPGLPEVAERARMASKINGYGKTWHTWHPHGDAGADGAMPLGPARLAWSFNRDGELDPALLAARDARLDIDSAALRAARQPLTATARPQSGVDALAPRFPQATPMPGVTDADAPPATGLPR